MTPSKEKQKLKNRPATVVFQRMTPELMLAYRIFSPGLGDQEGLEKLNVQMDRIINDVCVGEEIVVENGKKVRKEIGMLEDIKRQMNVTQKQIQEAYKAYKAEIERMMEEDQAYLAEKARGDGGGGTNEKRGGKRKSSSSSPTSAKRVQRKPSSSPIEASNATRKSSIDVDVDGTANDCKEDEGEPDDLEDDDEDIDLSDDDEDDTNDEDTEDEDETKDKNALCEIPTDWWMTKTQALTKLATALRRVEAMRGTLDVIYDFYTTQMIQRHDITSTFTSAFSYMTRLGAYVQEIYEIVECHDGEECEGGEINIWEDDRKAVTRLVPRLIPMADEIPLRVEAMEKLMEEVSAAADDLVKAAVEPARKRFRIKLARLVKQAHTPVPPPYDMIGYGTRAPGAKRRRQEMQSGKSQEESLGQGSSNKRAKTTEVITIDDD